MHPESSASKKAIASAIALVLSLSLLAACRKSAIPASGKEGTTDPLPTAETVLAPTDPPSSKRRARQPGDLSKRIWWNQQEVVQALALETEQRRRMDEIFHAFVLRGNERREHQRQTAEDYYLRLENGDWSGAREAIRKLAIDGMGQISDQPQMKIDILSLLTPEQMIRFREEYSNLFRQPWLRQVQMGGPRSTSQPAREGPIRRDRVRTAASPEME